ncbi:reverse transcriptase domain-containing protein [Tanacetum coccineum]
MGIQKLRVYVDSNLVENQINGEFEARGIRYVMKAREYVEGFHKFKISHVPRALNHKADALRNLAATTFLELTKQVLVDVLNERSTEIKEVNTVVEEEGDTWMTPLIKCIEKDEWLGDPNEGQKLKLKLLQYVMEDGVLIKKSYLVPMLRCVGTLQANYVIREIHMSSCGMHSGPPRSLVVKAMTQGYYWPTMHSDAR